MTDFVGYTRTLDVFGIEDDGRPLPFVQLGDVFFANTSCRMFVVVNASCDLQFVPEHVWKARGIAPSQARSRNRQATLLLVPGVARGIEAPSQSKFNTGLVRLDDGWYSIDWLVEEIVAVPHCLLRILFEDKGYQHFFRLQMSRAIELQQRCFSQLSRVGLEVQPPLHREYRVRVFTNDSGTLAETDIELDAVAFHSGRVSAAVLKYESLTVLRNMLQSRTELSGALGSLSNEFYHLHKTPFALPEKPEIGQFKILSRDERKQLLKFGTIRGVPPAMTKVNNKFELVLSFVEKPGG